MTSAGRGASKPALFLPLVLLLAFAPACSSSVEPPYTRRTTTTATPAFVSSGGGSNLLEQQPPNRPRQRRRLAQGGCPTCGALTVTSTCAESLEMGVAYYIDEATVADGAFACSNTFQDPQGSWLCVEGPFELAPGQTSTLGSYQAAAGPAYLTLYGTTTANAPYGAAPIVWDGTVLSTENGEACTGSEPGCNLYYLFTGYATVVLYCTAGSSSPSPNPSPAWYESPDPGLSPSPSSPTTTNQTASSGGGGGVSTGVVVGAAVGGAVALAALALLVVLWRRRRHRQQQHQQQEFVTAVSSSLDGDKLGATSQHPGPPPPPFGGEGNDGSAAAALAGTADGYRRTGMGGMGGDGSGGVAPGGWSGAAAPTGGPLAAGPLAAAAAAAAAAAVGKTDKETAPEAGPQAGGSMDELIPKEQQYLDGQYHQYQEAQYQQNEGAEASLLSTYPTRPPGGPPASALSLMGGNHANTQQLPQQQQVQQQQADWQQQQQHHAQQQQADGLGAAANQAASLPRSEASTGPPATPDPMAAPYLSAASAATTTATLNTASSSTPSTAAALLSEDPILTYINTKLPTTLQGTSASAPAPPAIPGAAPAPRRAISALAATPGGGVVDAGSWEVSFQELSIVKPIGEGSFGRVYLALWNQTSVAVKILIDREAIHREQARGGEESTALMLPPELQAKLDEEAGLMARMRHPHVVSFLGVCRTPPCLLTEYCSRGSLSNVLARARRDTTLAAQLTWHRRLHMALDAALGMLYLHTRQPPIVHRDLKSPNLLVDEWWRVKVSDFNLSRILEEGGRSSSLAAMNPRWLAPEVMRGGRATQPADVFAFGVIMWELLTWHLPWTSSEVSGWQLVNLVMGGGRLEVPARGQLPGADPPPAGELDTYVALMRECWAEEALARPSFADVSVRLRDLAEQAVDVEPPPTGGLRARFDGAAPEGTICGTVDNGCT